MKYLVISDTHLTNRVEKRKFAFLLNLIEPYENIIINGDFFEAKYIDSDKFLNSGYKPLFDALKSRNTVYIYGNHDPEMYAKKVAERVSNQQFHSFKLISGDKKLHFEHGHRFIPEKSTKFDKILKNKFFLKWADTIGSGIFERFLFPFSVGYLGNKWNQITFASIHNDKSIDKDAIVVCGHTHVTVYDPKNRFIDIGKIRANAASYLIVDKGDFNLVKTMY